MADKYLKNVNGQIAEATATVTGGSETEAGDIVALDAGGKLSSSIMPIGIGADTESIPAFENLSAGDVVNIFNNAGTRGVRKADASNGRRAHGFINSAVASAAAALVYKKGTITGVVIAAADVGLPYYLDTNGGHTKTAPIVDGSTVMTGHLSQEIGYSVGTSALCFEAQQPITLA